MGWQTAHLVRGPLNLYRHYEVSIVDRLEGRNGYCQQTGNPLPTGDSPLSGSSQHRAKYHISSGSPFSFIPHPSYLPNSTKSRFQGFYFDRVLQHHLGWPLIPAPLSYGHTGMHV